MILQPYPEDARDFEFDECGMWTAVPFEAYCLWPAIDKTGLWLLHNTTPAHYRYALDHPTREERERECLLVGHASHAFTLDDATSRELYVVRPKTYTADRGKDDGKEKPWNSNAIVCKEWIKTIGFQGKIVLTQRQWDLAHAIKDAVWKFESSRMLIDGAEVEVSMIWNDPQTGLSMKARIDILHGGVLADLKTCRCAAPGPFGRDQYRLGGHVQGAAYLEGAQILAGTTFEDFVYIAAENEPPHLVKCYDLQPDDLELAKMQYHITLDRLAFCKRKDRWDGYGQEISPLVLPSWAGHELQG